MRPTLRPWLGCALVALSAALAEPALAGPSAGGLSSDNVEYVGNVGLQGHGNGGRLVGRHFYVTSNKDLTIFDVSVPEQPRQVGHLDLYPLDVFYYGTGYQEEVDTNGRVLLRSGNTGPGTVGLQVVDVRDPARTEILATLEGVDQHTISCILDCTWAYGSEGAVVDLRDPARPRVAGDWRDAAGGNSPHDVTEVAPGIVLTSSLPMVLLDARTDPAAPTVLAETEMPGFVHGNEWPNQMSDEIALAGGETLKPLGAGVCDDDPDARFYTLDTRGWQTTGAFRVIAEFGMHTGTAVDGSAPYSSFCTHWFDAHPAFRNGGLVAMAATESGTRMLEVDTAGAIEEIGWFLPHGGQTWSVHWITDQIAYAVDWRRGIDVLRFTGELPPGRPPAAGAPTTPPTALPPSARAVSFNDLVRLPSNRRCVTARSLRVGVRRHASDPVVAVTVRVDGRRKLTARGRRLRRPVRLRTLPTRRFALQVEVRTRSGHTTAAQRTYRTCRRP